ncbi:hypothetical protein [Streptomyces sp. CLCI03]
MTESHRGGPVDVDASNHTFWLVDTAQMPGAESGEPNGLIAVTQPGAAVVITGVHTGPVAVTVEVRTTPPEMINASEWDEVVEVFLLVPMGQPAAGILTDVIAARARRCCPNRCPPERCRPG